MLRDSAIGQPLRIQRPVERRSTPLGVRLLSYAILFFWLFVVLAPLYWVVITSFKMPITIRMGASYLPWIDFPPVLDNWRFLLNVRQSDLVDHTKNSVIVTLGGTTVAVLFGSMAGYALARFEYRFFGLRSHDIALFFIAQRIFSPFILILPLLIVYGFLGLLDTHFGLMLAYVSFNLPLVVWITRDFFASLPKDLEESAMIDGCSRWQAFLRIALPLALPGLAAAYVLCFIFTWNEYLIGLMLTIQHAQTLPVYLAGRGYGAALTLFSVLPTLIVGVSCERLLTRRLISASLK
jgi:multiple sugar transport system permease protein